MEQELIARAQSGDREAFGQLLELHYDFIRSVAWRWSGRGSDADDIAQDVCVRLATALKSFRGEGRLRTWLYTLTLNAARDHGRKNSRERQKADAWLADPTVQAADCDDGPTEALWAAVRQLPTKQCDAVLLVYAEGLNHSAAADVMGCSEATVSWHVHEARKRLKQILLTA